MIATAGLYTVCRLKKQPRAFAEVAQVSKRDEEWNRHCYRILNREWDLPVPSAGPRQYLADRSGLDPHHETVRRARELLEQADDSRIANGQNPMGAAAGALYLASRQTGEHLNQKTVADAADVSKVTVRERYRDLLLVSLA